MAPEMVLETVEIVKAAIEKGVLVNLIINNRAGGNAPIIAQIIAKKFMPENRPTSSKQALVINGFTSNYPANSHQ
jgi:hypothetical protein